MYLLLYESLPLRTSRMLGDFADDFALPHRLGDMRSSRFLLRKLSDTEWFAADHAMEVTAVQIDDESISGWEQQTRTDVDGNTWTVVVLAAPAPPNASVTASGIGRLDARTGRLIENPADIMEYMLRLAGRSEIFPQLRAETAAEGITHGGSIDVFKSIRSWLDNVAYSCGGVWTPELARLYPNPIVRGAVTDLDRFNAANIVVTTDIQDTCDVLRVSYNIDESNGRALNYVEISARPYSYGGVSKEVVLTWVRNASNAESIGRRMLQRMAGKTYTIALTATGDIGSGVRPCQWVRLNDHPGWPIDDTNPVAMALATSITPDQRSSEIALEVTTAYPSVVVTAHSLAVPFEVGAAVDVAIVNGVARFTILDGNSKPIQDALVSLDGAAPKKTDGQGRVYFSITPAIPPRRHELAVDAPGFTPFVLDVYL